MTRGGRRAPGKPRLRSPEDLSGVRDEGCSSGPTEGKGCAALAS